MNTCSQFSQSAIPNGPTTCGPTKKTLVIYRSMPKVWCCHRPVLFNCRLHSEIMDLYKPVYWVVQWSWFARVNTLCNLSHKKSQEVTVSLPGQFLSRRCFMLCITMEVEPRIAKQYKCHHSCSCKNYQGKGMEGEKKCLGHLLADQKIARSWKKCILGHPIARATSYCLLLDTFWLWASRNALKVGSVKFTVAAFHCKEITHRK